MIGPEARSAVPAFIAVCKGPDQDLRQAAAIALGHIGPAAVPALGELFKEKSGTYRVVAALALQFIGEAAVPTLVQALQGEDVELRRVAAASPGHGAAGGENGPPRADPEH